MNANLRKRQNNQIILGIYSKSDFIFDKLFNKTAPLGLLVTLSNKTYKSIVYNEMVSGDVLQQNNLVANCNIVLFTVTVANISRTIKLSNIFHKMKKKVYWGGPEVSMTGPVLLKYHPYIDGLVIGAGESVIDEMLMENDKSGRVFLQKNVNNYAKLFNQFFPVKSLLQFSTINVNYNLLYDLDKYEGLSYLWGNDCSQAKKRCYFCGRMSLGLGYRPSDKIWEELLEQYRRGVRFFYNTTDSVTTNLNLFEEFCNSKPMEIKDAVHRVFVNSNKVNEKLINSLKKINGIAVMGIESFYNFKNVGKAGIKDIDNIKAIEKLYNANLKFVLSFVFGIPGDTPESIDHDIEMIKSIVYKYGSNIDSIHISPLLITTGSRAFYKLFKVPEIKKKYENSILPLNAIELSTDYFKYFCNISRTATVTKIINLSKQINIIAPHIMIGAKGILKTELVSDNIKKVSLNNVEELSLKEE